MKGLRFIIYTGLFFSVLCAGVAPGAAQDYNWSQPFATPLLNNPAEAGSAGGMRAGLKYKKAWPELAAPFKTAAVLFDMPLGGRQGNSSGGDNVWGVGIYAINDRAGDPQLTTNIVALNAAYQLKINASSSMGAGFSAGLDQRSTNVKDGRWASQYNGYFYDPGIISGESFGQESESHLELGGGIRYRYLKQPERNGSEIRFLMEAGVSGRHLGRIRMGSSDFLTSNMTPLFTAYVRNEMPIGQSTALTPAVVAYYAAGAYEIMAGAGIRQLLVYGDSFIRKIHQSSAALAVYYKVERAIVVQGRLIWGDYALGLSYDLDISDLEQYSSGRGGFELNLGWIPVKKQ